GLRWGGPRWGRATVSRSPEWANSTPTATTRPDRPVRDPGLPELERQLALQELLVHGHAVKIDVRSDRHENGSVELIVGATSGIANTYQYGNMEFYQIG
ncbi:hypothetical protein GTV15_16210, partial [Streptomyces sp. SID7803]|nr:hypothetical protein [Streptomyces sp. SID7803]